VLLRDRLLAGLDEMGDAPDYVRLASDVLGIRNAPPALARKLVSQALVLEDRRDAWTAAGEQIVATAPVTPGVYVLRDTDGQSLYVGKAVNLKRRLRAHFAPRRWRGLKAPLARVAQAEWFEVGSELEALLREAALIRDLRPIVNVQIGPPKRRTREVPPSLWKDVLLVLPSVEPARAELVGARADGGWFQQSVARDGRDLATHVRRVFRFFRSPLRTREDLTPLAPLVFSWLAARGAKTTRLDPLDAATLAELETRLVTLLGDADLFTERLVLASGGRLARRAVEK
jgi:predicted GIY-YIG superfamily endonuclease